MGKKRAMTAAELVNDPEYQRKHAELKQKSDEARREYKEHAAGLLTELDTAGFPVESVGELLRQLKTTGRSYTTALPLLAKWLPKVSDARVKEDIVRTMSIRGGEPYLPLLVSEFDKSPPGALRWAIGNAIEILANDSVAPDMIRIATDRSLLRDREMVVLGLAKLRGERAVTTLITLLRDPDVIAYAARALGDMRAVDAVPDLNKVLATANRSLASIIKAALAKIEKASKKQRR